MGIGKKWGLTYDTGAVSRIGWTIIIIIFLIMVSGVLFSIFQSKNRSDVITDINAVNTLKQVALRYIIEDSTGKAYEELHSMNGLTLTIVQLVKEKQIGDIPVDSSGKVFLALNVRADNERYNWIFSHTKDTDLKISDNNFGKKHKK